MDTNVLQVGTAEAKRCLSDLINRVYYGQRRIIITSRGKPKVAIIPVDELADTVGTPTSPATQPQARAEALKLIDQVHQDIVKTSQGKLLDPVKVLAQLRLERDKQIIKNSLH